MINCKYIGYNEKVLFGNIVNEKSTANQFLLKRIENRVLSTYDEYCNNFAVIQNKARSELSSKEEPEKAALKICYSSATETFKYVRGKIFNSQPNSLKAFCPYCLLDKPKTLDHYVGQTEFPEYSILVRNLIPCCYDCNQKKGEVWRKNRQRRFIHFYNDTFFNNRFLYAKLTYPRGQRTPFINYYLVKNPAITNDEFKIIKTHFKDLQLIREYNLRAHSLVSSEINTIKNAIANGSTRLQVNIGLIQRFNSISVDFGINYWSGVMYETLANTAQLKL